MPNVKTILNVYKSEVSEVSGVYRHIIARSVLLLVCLIFSSLLVFLRSFLLDLQTDECDCGFIIEKPEKETVDSKLKKAFTPMKKSKPKGVMDGVPLTQEGVCQVLLFVHILENVWHIL